MSLVAQKVKNLSAKQETQLLPLSQEDSPGERNGYPLHFFLGMLEESSPSPAENRPEGFLYGIFLSWIQLSVLCVKWTKICVSLEYDYCWRNFVNYPQGKEAHWPRYPPLWMNLYALELYCIISVSYCNGQILMQKEASFFKVLSWLF